MGKDTCKETHVEFSVDLHRHAARNAEGDYVGGHVDDVREVPEVALKESEDVAET